MNLRKLAMLEAAVLNGFAAIRDSSDRIRKLRSDLNIAKATLASLRGDTRVYGISIDMRSAEQCETDIAKWTPELEAAVTAHDALAETVTGRRALAESCRRYVDSHKPRPGPSPDTPRATIVRQPGSAPTVAHMKGTAADIRSGLASPDGLSRMAASATPTVRR